MDISMELSNMTQAMAGDCASLTNLMTSNINRLSTKEADNVVLKTSIKNLQGEVKNQKDKVATRKKSVHSGGAIDTKHKRGRPRPNLNIEGQSHNPKWWRTSYYWIHGAGGHSGS